MRTFPREILQLVEWLLREYPARESELQALDRFIEDCCHAVRPDAEPSGLSVKRPVSPQEKIVEAKERSGHYRWLARFLERLREALALLDKDELRFVDCLYWQDMTIQAVACELERDRRTVFRIRKQVAEKLAAFILPELLPGS